MMAEKKGGFSFPNPFGKKKSASSNAGGFAELQPGDPGYKPASSARKAEAEASPAEEAPKKQEVQAKASEMKEQSPTPPKKEKSGFVSALSGMAQSARDSVPSFGDKTGNGKRGIDLLREDIFKSAPEKVGVGRQDAYGIMPPQPGEPGYKSKESAKPVSERKEKKEGRESSDRAQFGGRTDRIEPVSPSPEMYDIPDYLKPLPSDEVTSSSTWQNFIDERRRKAASAYSNLPDYLLPVEDNENRPKWSND